MKSKALIATATLLVLVAFAVFFFAWYPNHTEVRNMSGRTITDVVLELRDRRTDWAVGKTAATLSPGEGVKIRHSHNDATAVIQFGMDGQRFRYEEAIELWTGEGWRSDIQPDGTLKSRHDHVE